MKIKVVNLFSILTLVTVLTGCGGSGSGSGSGNNTSSFITETNQFTGQFFVSFDGMEVSQQNEMTSTRDQYQTLLLTIDEEGACYLGMEYLSSEQPLATVVARFEQSRVDLNILSKTSFNGAAGVAMESQYSSLSNDVRIGNLHRTYYFSASQTSYNIPTVVRVGCLTAIETYEPQLPIFRTRLDSLQFDSIQGAQVNDTNPSSDVEPTTEQAPSALSPAISPPGLFRLNAYATYQFINGFYQPGDAMVALFDDGTYTSALATVFSKGRDATQRWGEYELRGDQLYLRPNANSQFKAAMSDFPAVAGGADERLTGCFAAFTTSAIDFPDISSGLVRTFCFGHDGRFTNDSAHYVNSSSSVSGGSSGSSGYYRVDGYAISFQYDSGEETTASFGFLNSDKSNISLNGTRYLQ